MKTYIILFLFSVGSCLASTNAQTCTVPLGATLSPLFWNNNTSNWFIDYMKMSKPGFGPISGPWDPGGPTLTPDGWPTETFSIWVKLGVYTQDTGVYHLSFEGFADVRVDLGMEIFDKEYHAMTNTTHAKVRVTPDAQQIVLFFDAPMSAVVRDIKLIAPGFDPNAYPTFHPDWVEHAAKFPLLRFMTWNAANYDATVKWQDRKRVDSPTQAPAVVSPQIGEGVAWEYVIEMANLTGAHIWVSVPVLADDDYIRQLANMLKSGLQSHQQIHLELANEVWNTGQFPYHANRQKAIQEVNTGNSDLNYDGNTQLDIWAQRLYARRTKEMAEIFLEVFGQAAFNQRVFPVLGHQVVSPSNQLRNALEYIDQRYGPPEQYFSAVAGAPFLPLLQLDTVSNLTVDKYFQIANQQLVKMYREEDSFLTEGITWATYYKVPYRSHEAGIESTLSRTAPLTVRQTVANAQSDPRMRQLIHDYLEKWYRFAGPQGMLTWFVAGGSDWLGGETLGLSNGLNDTENTKTQAIDQVLQMQCPPQEAGFAIPGTLDARKYARFPQNWQSVPFNQVVFQGNNHQYLIRAEQAGTYCMRMVLEKPQLGDAVFEISMNNVVIDTIRVAGAQTPGIDTVFFTNLTMNTGLHTVRIKYLTWCYGTHALIFEEGSACSTASYEPEQKKFTIYPNPNNGKFTIQLANHFGQIQILNTLGKVVYETRSHGASQLEVQIPHTNLHSGIYWLRIGQKVQPIFFQLN